MQELNGPTVAANLLTGGIDEYFTRTDSNGASNFLTDALGGTVELASSTGTPQVNYSYGPFGAIEATGTTDSDYTYAGREADGLGLYYDRARYYNPAVGRFISEDPIGLFGGINEYVYVDDDPMEFKDPLGTDKCNGGGNGAGSGSGPGSGAGSDGLDQFAPLFNADHELESIVANDIVLPGSLIGSGAAVSTLGGMTIVIGVAAGPLGWFTLVPLGGAEFVSGVGLGVEGIEYGIHHDFINPTNPFGPTIPGLPAFPTKSGGCGE